MISYYAYSEVGSKRPVNEDRGMVNYKCRMPTNTIGKTKDEILAVVCDGVGSTNGGAIAAEIIVKSFERFSTEDCSPRTVIQHIQKANEAIAMKQRKNQDLQNMASTVAGLIISGNRFLSFHLGDTRIYKYYAGNISLLTKDHTEVTPQGSNVITRYLGGNGSACIPSFRKGNAETGSLFLLCTDGVHKSISEFDIIDILSEEATIDQKGKAILKLALQNGSTDDRSLVLVESVS